MFERAEEQPHQELRFGGADGGENYQGDGGNYLIQPAQPGNAPDNKKITTFEDQNVDQSQDIENRVKFMYQDDDSEEDDATGEVASDNLN